MSYFNRYQRIKTTIKGIENMRQATDLKQSDLVGKTIMKSTIVVASQEELERFFNTNPDCYLEYVLTTRNHDFAGKPIASGLSVNYWKII